MWFGPHFFKVPLLRGFALGGFIGFLQFGDLSPFPFGGKVLIVFHRETLVVVVVIDMVILRTWRVL